MCVVLICKLATHNEQMLKLPRVSLLQILPAMFLPNIIGGSTVAVRGIDVVQYMWWKLAICLWRVMILCHDEF